jgi:hypothetical protein
MKSNPPPSVYTMYKRPLGTARKMIEEQNARDLVGAGNSQDKNDFYILEIIKLLTLNKINAVKDTDITDAIKELNSYSKDSLKKSMLVLDKQDVLEGIKNIANRKELLANDKKFIEVVVGRAEETLNTKYLKDSFYTNYKFQFAQNSQNVTIPQLIKAVKLLVDQSRPSQEEKKELCVVAFINNPDLVESKLGVIRQEIQDPSIALEKLTGNKRQLYELFNTRNINFDKLFHVVTGHDIDTVAKDQKLFTLTKNLYIASTLKGDNSPACMNGTYSQVMSAALQIHPKLLDDFIEYKSKQNQQQTLKTTITENNIEEFSRAVASELIKVVKKQKPQLHEALADFAVAGVDISKPQDCTKEQKEVLVLINNFFATNIKKYLPNYSKTTLTEDECKILVEKLSEVPAMQKFAQATTQQAAVQSPTTLPQPIKSQLSKDLAATLSKNVNPKEGSSSVDSDSGIGIGSLSTSRSSSIFDLSKIAGNEGVKSSVVLEQNAPLSIKDRAKMFQQNLNQNTASRPPIAKKPINIKPRILAQNPEPQEIKKVPPQIPPKPQAHFKALPQKIQAQVAVQKEIVKQNISVGNEAKTTSSGVRALAAKFEQASNAQSPGRPQNVPRSR